MTPRHVIELGFVLVGIAIVTAELAGRRRGGEPQPLGPTLVAVLRRPAGRAILLLIWLWLGWHFLSR